MIRHLCTAAFLAAGLISTSHAMAADTAPAGHATKPNVIVILSDDVGWAEFGFQRSKDIPTPNIDSIAKNGVKFTNGYVAAAICSVSRAGLMLGRYPTRIGYEFNGGDDQALPRPAASECPWKKSFFPIA